MDPKTRKYLLGRPLSLHILNILAQGVTRSQDFLSSPLIRLLFAMAPPPARKPLALNILSISPHYYKIEGYPKSMGFREILEAEHARNTDSRKQIREVILKKYITPDMVVLDFGCGPGYVSYQAGFLAKRVIGVDVSDGAVACARIINNLPNITYVRTNDRDLSAIGDHTVNVVISFAVLFHLSNPQISGFMKEFHRVLTPGGIAVLHVAIRGSEVATQLESSPRVLYWLKKNQTIRNRLGLRYIVRTADYFVTLSETMGFCNIDVLSIANMGQIQDDVGRQHLLIFRKPVT